MNQGSFALEQSPLTVGSRTYEKRRRQRSRQDLGQERSSRGATTPENNTHSTGSRSRTSSNIRSQNLDSNIFRKEATPQQNDESPFEQSPTKENVSENSGSGDLDNTKEIRRHLDVVDKELKSALADCDDYERKAYTTNDNQEAALNTADPGSFSNVGTPAKGVLEFGFNSVLEKLTNSENRTTTDQKPDKKRNTQVRTIPDRPRVQDILRGPPSQGNLNLSTRAQLKHDCTKSQSPKLRSTLTKVSKALDHSQAFGRQLPLVLSEVSGDLGKHLTSLNRLWRRTAVCFKHRMNFLSDMRKCSTEEQRRRLVLQEYSSATEKLDAYHRLCDMALEREQLKRRLYELRLRSGVSSKHGNDRVRLVSRSKEGIELDCSAILRGLILETTEKSNENMSRREKLMQEFRECSSRLKTLDQDLISTLQHSFMFYGVRYIDIMEAEKEIKELFVEACASKEAQRLL